MDTRYLNANETAKRASQADKAAKASYADAAGEAKTAEGLSGLLLAKLNTDCTLNGGTLNRGVVSSERKLLDPDGSEGDWPVCVVTFDRELDGCFVTASTWNAGGQVPTNRFVSAMQASARTVHVFGYESGGSPAAQWFVVMALCA